VAVQPPPRRRVLQPQQRALGELSALGAVSLRRERSTEGPVMRQRSSSRSGPGHKQRREAAPSLSGRHTSAPRTIHKLCAPSLSGYPVTDCCPLPLPPPYATSCECR
jgi:hypothetical protein